jgi:hypothetical protein
MQSAQFSARFLSHNLPFVRFPMRYRYLLAAYPQHILSNSHDDDGISPPKQYSLSAATASVTYAAHEEMRAQSEPS